MSDQDEESFRGVFDQGHWEWDDVKESLVFISDLPALDDVSRPTPTLIGSFEFNEDLDLLEQQRFRKRFQRNSVEYDVVYLQDIKDLVLFTAPKAILSPALVDILHLPMIERFIRALLLYCQYFIQISDEMSRRIMELHVKIRTPKSDETELEFRENLEDLRLLVGKEYSCIIMGSAEIAKYHHMGLSKKMRSLTKRDSILFESLLRISIQIVWIALGRQSYNQIELEIHRLFKSEIYNIIEHKINTRYENVLSERELFVLYGHCVHRNRMINTHSPLFNEMQCGRDIDYRLLGLGTVKYPKLSKRLRYLERVLTAPEKKIEELEITLGILGLPRARFDTMLMEIKMPSSAASSASSFRQSIAKLTSASRASRVSTSMKKSALQQKLYGEINIPDKYEKEERIPDRFPMEMLPNKQCNDEQRRRWMSYASLIMSKMDRRKN